MLLNVSFGIYAFMPQGWIFMSVIVLLECLVASKVLTKRWLTKKISSSIIYSNLISGIIGISVTMLLNGGWALVVWFPWIGRHEFDLTQPGMLTTLIIFYLIAFALTLIFEIATNILFLRKQFSTKQIIKATLMANIVSYAVGSIALYSFTF